MISKNVFLAADFKHMDTTCGIESRVLMKNAAECLYHRLQSEKRLEGKISIICGKGNNGGDGYALGELLLCNGADVCVLSVEEAKTNDAIYYMKRYASLGGVFVENIKCALDNCSTIVDCIFGFSFKGEVVEIYKQVVEAINTSNCYVLSADLPSGISADSDSISDCFIKANATAVFSANKIATVSFPAKTACGKIFVEDIGIPSSFFKSPYAFSNGNEFIDYLPYRSPLGYKYTFGTLSALVGSEMMPGAAYLSCLAALQSGVGLVRLFSDASCLKTVSTRLAEPVLSTINDTKDLLSKKHTALLIGCGCGRQYDTIIKELIKSSNVPTVLDADGINCIAGDIQLYKSMQERFIITPHEMEMSRLLNCDVSYVNGHRIECAKRFSDEYDVITVLKGAATIVAEPHGRLYINNTGNSGLSKGGSGDVLSGLTASLIAQGIPLFEAAVIAVYIHGKAADNLESQIGQYAMLPSMLPLEIGKLLDKR